MIIDFYNRNGGGGSGEDPQMRASGFTGVELSGTTLEFSNLEGTEVDSIDLSDIGGASDVLEPKTSIPESGAAGTVIALNKPDEYGWKAYSGYNAEKSRTAISFHIEPSENPNPDLSQYPTRYQIDVNYADSVDKNGNYTYSNSTTVELSVDYQGNITFTNLGNFSQDGDVYSLTSDIYDIAAGESIQKTLYMSLENGYLYFNNGQGDCPYHINIAYQYYWQDGGYWDESDPENPVWQESWSENTDYPNYQEWGIASPAKIGIYQANSGGTYEEFDTKNADYATEAGFARKIKKYQGGASSDSFNAGDMIISEDYGYRPRVKMGDGEGMDYEYEALAYQQEVLTLNNKVDNLKIYELTATGETPIYVDNGNLIAVHNSGETVVKQAYAESGFTYIPYNNNAEGCYGVKFYTPNDYMQFCVGINNGTDEAMVWVFWQNGDWDLSGWNDWTITTTGTSWTATDNAGNGYVVEGYVDGDYGYVSTNAPVVTIYGVNGVSDVRVPQTVYQTAVMSKQGINQIVSISAADYAQITPDANTIYIVI